MQYDDVLNDNVPPDWTRMDMALNGNDRRGSRKRSHEINSREYAIAWGVKNCPYSDRQLQEMCYGNENAPSYRFLVRKCWKGFLRYYKALVAAGMKPRPPRNDSERRRIVGSARSTGVKRLLGSDYDIARLAAQYGVVTRKEYIKLRNENEEAKMLLPGSRTVEFRYGTWSRFAYEIKKYNADLVITEYVRKSAECGHWLRLHECDRMKIPIRGIMDLLRSRVFNSLCYRKLKALGLESNIDEYSGNASAGEEPGRSGSEV